MQNEPRFTLVSPSAGFTWRVMTRIAEHERAQARRRALIGSALLVVVAGALLALVGAQIVVWLTAFAERPEVLELVVSALAAALFWLGAFAGALWIAVGTILANIGEVTMLVYALGVLTLTMVWLRVATGSPTLSLTT